MIEVLIRYFHFASILVLYAALTSQHVFAKPVVDADIMRRLRILDITYGVAAVIVLGCGLSLWLWVGKPAEFYSANWIFHLKVGLFVATGLASIIPTKFFLSQRNNAQPEIHIPKRVINMIRLELTIVIILPLLAVLMARGTGLS